MKIELEEIKEMKDLPASCTSITEDLKMGVVNQGVWLRGKGLGIGYPLKMKDGIIVDVSSMIHIGRIEFGTYESKGDGIYLFDLDMDKIRVLVDFQVNKTPEAFKKMCEIATERKIGI